MRRLNHCAEQQPVLMPGQVDRLESTMLRSLKRQPPEILNFGRHRDDTQHGVAEFFWLRKVRVGSCAW